MDTDSSQTSPVNHSSGPRRFSMSLDETTCTGPPFSRPLLRQAALEERVEARLPGVLRYSLLHLQRGFPAAEFEGGDVVVEPGFFVRQSPANPWFFDAGQASEGSPDQLATPRPAALKPTRSGRPSGFLSGELTAW